MKPFRTSLTARMVSFAVMIALVGGGLIATFRVDDSYALPILLLACIGTCIAALVLGVQDHGGPVALLAILLPLVLWPFVMVLEAVVERYPQYGVELIIAGVLVGGASLFAGMFPVAHSHQHEPSHAS